MQLLNQLIQSREQSQKWLAVLVDPDKMKTPELLKQFIGSCEYAKVDLILVGGSLLLNDSLYECISVIKSTTHIPVVIFPGSPLQISDKADAILFLSLISGRNPELLIGNHVTVAPYLKKTGIEILPTGYILVDCGNATTVSYISNTQPIPYHKPEIAAVTALAGEMLGLKLIYVDGGSGAQKPVSQKCLELIKQQTSVPLITGGGIRSLDDAQKAWNAGADVVVVGTAFENDPQLILSFRNRTTVSA
ncbi:MAG TPA: geranylgeranylglyceryl/heptaprenylglyceryl phosphate synthase [Flavobacteriales bacterium]|nr:geranylgeranylglyceryl/heptaprenylglyceryl phosphate synthase [Flavobacteriales bacterium]